MIETERIEPLFSPDDRVGKERRQSSGGVFAQVFAELTSRARLSVAHAGVLPPF